VASITAAKRTSAAKKSPPKLPYEKTDDELAAISAAEVKHHFAPKRPPPKVYIPPRTVRHFAETRAKSSELASDYDRSIIWSSRADVPQHGSSSAKGKTIAQLGEKENQSITPLIVHSYDDPETAEIVTRMATDLGTSVQYQDDYPMAELAYRYTYGKPLVRPEQLPHLPT
jgi:hypothetical protein